MQVVASGRSRKSRVAWSAAANAARNDGSGAGYDCEQLPLTSTNNGASIAAPIRIGNTDYIAVAVVLQDVNQNRFYLHEVALKEKLQGPAFKTEALTTKRGALNGADQPGVIKKLLINIFSVNPDEVSKAVDANGEPLATEALFEQLDAGAASGSNPNLLMQAADLPSSDFVKSLKEVDPKSANFKKWFQDSKIVDEEGNPLAVVSGLSRKSRVA